MIPKIGLIGVETPADRGGWGGDFLSNIVGMEEQIYNMVPGRGLRTIFRDFVNVKYSM